MRLSFLLILGTAFSCAELSSQSLSLSIHQKAGGPGLGLSSRPIAPVAGTDYRIKLESSSDLRSWTPAGEVAPSMPLPTITSSGETRSLFFRASTQLEETTTEPSGADLYGFSRIFQEELTKAGFLTPEQFAGQNPIRADYLPAITFDPRTAKYWDRFSADLAVVNQGLGEYDPQRRHFDFRLNEKELGCFLTNGFVVNERLGSPNFADVYYRIFNDDFPVYVTADSVLHAWHYSYQKLLAESEETQLMPSLKAILQGQHDALAALPPATINGPLAASIRDADYFLAVGRNLLADTNVPSILGQDKLVADTLAAIKNLAYQENFPIFGTTRPVDFSQFAVRGHYERGYSLPFYFRAYMWTARTDLRILSADPSPQHLRELGTAVVLTKLLSASEMTQKWKELDAIIRAFVGAADSMNMPQLDTLLEAEGIHLLSDVTSTEPLAKLQKRLFEGTQGAQLYAGDVYYSPFSTAQVQLPRSFAETGQRFIPDGWAMAQVTFDRILWNEEIPGVTWCKKVTRCYPSALDVAYAVLGNQQTGPLVAERMLNVEARSGLRDGYPYAHNLTALAETFDRISTDTWDANIYSQWLAALRTLSNPSTDARFPEAMRTRAWAMRTLNTQLASYTQLKHDTVLYAKQPHANTYGCEYPAGFVEPVPEFWRKMGTMAQATAKALQQLPVWGWQFFWDPATMETASFELQRRQAARVSFCQYFGQQMAVLATMADKELSQTPFDTNEIAFIRGLMNKRGFAYGGATYDGWYPQLFYKDFLMEGIPDTAWSGTGCGQRDRLVTDIHTSVPGGADPQGGILHEAVRDVDLLMIAVDSGSDRMVYAGPVLSHYEFVVPGPQLKRMTDSEWNISTPPARPEWTRGYLVPKE